MIIPAPKHKGGRPRTQVDSATAWLRKVLADGPKSIIAIRKGSTARGDSWSTVRRSRKELQVITVFAQDRHLWALPGQVGQIGQIGEMGRANAPVGFETESEPVRKPIGELELLELKMRARAKQIEHLTRDDIAAELRRMKTSLPTNVVEPLILSIADEFKHISIWEISDPSTKIGGANDEDLYRLFSEVRNEMARNPASSPRLTPILGLINAERKRRT